MIHSPRFGRSRFLMALGGGALAILGLVVQPARAQELVIGSRVEVTPDPHFRWSAANVMFYRHYFSFLMDLNKDDQAVPGLAESAEVEGDHAWVFHLRPNLHFADGQKLTAADVVASFERARTLPNAAGPYAGLFAGVTEISAPDERTVRMTTNRAVPTLPNGLTQVSIIPASVAKTATTADFVQGSADVSSGAYRFVSLQPGNRLIVERNPDFYGPKARWARVTFRFMTDNAARTAALLGGDVDMIDGVAPQDMPRIKADGRFTVHVGRSDRGLFLMPDTERDVSPFIRDINGAPMTKNPLKDRRVREAMLLAIDREAIRTKVMDGLSFPTGQLVPEGFGGHSDKIPVPPFDPARSRALLAEAGYPEGFEVTLHCTNDRYVNDGRICQTIGQMLTRVGIKTDVQLLPTSAYFPMVTDHAGKRGSLIMMSWSAAGSGEADVLQNVIHTYNKETHTGTWNLEHYSNPAIDKLIEQSQITLDVTQRHALQVQAMEALMADVGVIPIHDQSVVVATKKNLDFTTWDDESTMAEEVVAK
jgi:peptide/nickel transport system substrate-binding protein